MKRKVALVCLMAVALAAAYLFLFGGWRKVPSDGAHKIRYEDRHSLSDRSEGMPERRFPEVSRKEEGLAIQARLSRTILVVDSQLQVPLRFTASGSASGVELVKLGVGRLLVAGRQELWREGIEIQFSSPGYAKQHILIDGQSPAVVRMHPVTESIIHLMDASRVISPAYGEIRYLDDGQARAIKADFNKQADGGVTICHAKPIYVHLYNEDDHLLFNGAVYPGAILWIRCGDMTRSARLVYENGVLVEGAPVGVYCDAITSISSSLQVSDSEGQFLLPGPGSGEITIALKTNRLSFASTNGNRQRDGLKSHNAVFLLEPGVGVDDPVDLVVEPTVNRIRFVDGVSGAAAEGRAFLLVRSSQNGKEPLEVIQHSFVLNDGWMDFPFGYSGRPWPESIRGLIALDGYLPFLLPQEASPFNEGLAKGLCFSLQPASQGKSLFLLDFERPVDRGVVSVHSRKTGELLYIGNASSELSYGPFRCIDDEVLVKSPTGGVLGVAYSSGNPRDKYILDIGAELGALRVEDNNSSLPPLYCVSAAGVEFDATFNDGAMCVFNRIPAGRYLVGPKEWVAQYANSTDGLRINGIEVRRGKVSVVSSDPAWNLRSEISGRVLLSPGVVAPSLLAVYPTPILPPVVRKSSQHIWMDLDGAYGISAGAPKPTAILAVDQGNGSIRVRGVFAPGGTYVLDEIVVELYRDKAPEGVADVVIRYEYDEGWSQLPIHTTLSRVDFSLNVGVIPKTFAVHQSIKTITLIRIPDGASRSVELFKDRYNLINLSELFSE